MKTYKGKWQLGMLGAGLLLLVGLGSVLEEVSFRRGATPVTGTVRAWESTKLFGLRGTAKVEIDRGNERSRSLRWPVKTHLWYRPRPGDSIALLDKTGAGYRVASCWQGFGLSMLAILAGIGWLMDVQNERRKDLSGKRHSKSEPKDEKPK